MRSSPQTKANSSTSYGARIPYGVRARENSISINNLNETKEDKHMSNYSISRITVWHQAPQFVRRIVNAFYQRKLLQEFIPIPESVQMCEPPVNDLGAILESIKSGDHSKLCEWCLEHWNTIGEAEYTDSSLKIVDPLDVNILVCTVGGAPIPIFDHWVSLGCQVRASVRQIDVGEIGIYDNTSGWRLVAPKPRNTKPGPEEMRRDILEAYAPL